MAKFLFFCLSISIQFSLSSSCVSKNTIYNIEIAIEDREILNTFFGALISSEYFGYVLCGSKPVGLLSLSLNPQFPIRRLNQLFTYMRIKSILMNGWCVWEKYQSKIYNSNFILLRNNDNNLFYVNKKTVLDVVGRNIDKFKEKICKDVTPEEILNMICSSKFSQQDFKSQCLLGILLGYGTENSMAYEYRTNLENQLQNPLLGNESQKLIAEALNKLNRKLDCFPNEPYEYQENINITWPLGFVITKTKKSRSENVELFKKYRADREIIAEAYKNRNFLDTTLRFFLNENSSSPTEIISCQ